MVADVPLRPLVEAEESWLADELSAGRRPFVHVLSASADLVAGARARLAAMDSPREGEYLLVEVQGDRLPFAASELALPATVARRVRKAAGVIDPLPAAKKRRTQGVAKAGRPKPVPAKAVANRTSPAASPSAPAPASATAAKAGVPKPGQAKPAPRTAPAKPALPPTSGKRPSSKRPRLSALSVTIAFDGAERWTVEGKVGSRRLRAADIPAGAAAAAVHALELPDVSAAVLAVTDALRDEALRRAEELRTQLAAAEAELERYR